MSQTGTDARGLGLTPHVVVSDGDAAIRFYKEAFGAVEIQRNTAPNSKKIMHAQIKLFGSSLMLCDDFPEFMGGRSSTPEAFGGTPITLHLQVQNADEAWAKAVAAGATVVMPLKDQFWGDRYGKLRDPFGLEWSIGQLIQALSSEEVEQAAEEMFVESPS